MRLIDDLISRLETKRMSVNGLQSVWCPCCLRVATRDPKIKGDFQLLSAGEPDCRQLLKFGTISECISDLLDEAKLRNDVS